MNKKYVLTIIILLGFQAAFCDMSDAFYPISNKYAQSSSFSAFRTSTYLHDGIDLAVPKDTSVYSIDIGSVEAVDTVGSGAYGKYVTVKHKFSYTRYCHLNSVLVDKNDPVTNLTIIGYSGNTGSITTGPHLHFECWDNGETKVNPIINGLEQPDSTAPAIQSIKVLAPGSDGFGTGVDPEILSNTYVTNTVRLVVQATDSNMVGTVSYKTGIYRYCITIAPNEDTSNIMTIKDLSFNARPSSASDCYSLVPSAETYIDYDHDVHYYYHYGTWNTKADSGDEWVYPDGFYTINATVYDANGNSLAATPKTIHVENDPTPSVSWGSMNKDSDSSGLKTKKKNWLPLIIRFSEYMKASTITADKITLKRTDNNVAVPFSISYNAAKRELSITPASNLSENVQYTLEISKDITDLVGNKLNGGTNKVINFTVADETPPSLINRVLKILDKAGELKSGVNAVGDRLNYSYGLSEDCQIVIKVVNGSGDEVKTLVNSNQSSGSPFETNWNIAKPGGGAYDLLVDNGNYYLKVSLKDLAGNTTDLSETAAVNIPRYSASIGSQIQAKTPNKGLGEIHLPGTKLTFLCQDVSPAILVADTVIDSKTSGTLLLPYGSFLASVNKDGYTFNLPGTYLTISAGGLSSPLICEGTPNWGRDDIDTDSDGIPDYWEYRYWADTSDPYSLSLRDPSDAAKNEDHLTTNHSAKADNFSNKREYQLYKAGFDVDPRYTDLIVELDSMQAPTAGRHYEPSTVALNTFKQAFAEKGISAQIKEDSNITLARTDAEKATVVLADLNNYLTANQNPNYGDFIHAIFAPGWTKVSGYPVSIASFAGLYLGSAKGVYVFDLDTRNLDSQVMDARIASETIAKYEGYVLAHEVGHAVGLTDDEGLPLADIMFHKNTDDTLSFFAEKVFNDAELGKMKVNLPYNLSGVLTDKIIYKPVISFVPFRKFIRAPDAIHIEANVIDLDNDLNPEVGEGYVKVVYSVNDGASWQSASLAKVDPDHTSDNQADDFRYAGSLPAQAEGTTVKYYLEAKDNYGNRVTDPELLPEAGASDLPPTFHRFIIDNTPPTFEISVKPPYFSPNNDNRADTTAVNYGIVDLSDFVYDLTVEAVTLDGALLKQLYSAELVSTNSTYPPVDWNGKNLAGEPLSDGRYKVQIYGKDQALNVGTASKEVTIDNTPPVIANVDFSIKYGAYPKVFTSNDTTVEVGFDLSDKLSPSVEASILYHSNSFVTVNQGVLSLNYSASADEYRRTGFISLWDGKDANGDFAADGNYTITVVATDLAQNTVNYSLAEQLRIDRTPAKVVALYVDNLIFSPDDHDGIKDTATISYQLSEPGYVTVVIEDLAGRPLLTSSDGTLKTTGNFTWDGKLNGAFAADGGYVFKVKTVDDVGNRAEDSLGIIKNVIPAQIISPADADKADAVYPNVNGQVVIRGTAVDPSVLSQGDFAGYRVWYRAGANVNFSLPENDPANPDQNIWQKIIVPAANQSPTDPNFPNANLSLRSVVNTTLAIWDTTGLTPGNNYTVLLTAKDKAGLYSYDYLTVTVGVDSGADNTAPSISLSAPAALSTFALATELSNLDITYSLTQNSGKKADVGLEIFKVSDSGSTVEALAYFQEYKGTTSGQTIKWNGCNYADKYVVSGRYRIKLMAKDTDGIGVGAAERDIYVNQTAGTPVKVTKLSPDPSTISPGGSTIIAYRLNKTARVTLQVKNIAGNVVATLVNSELTAGETDYSVNWSYGTVGLYTATISAVADDGTTDQAQESIVISDGGGGGSAGVSLTSPSDGAVIEGLSNFRWEATANGEYYPTQDYTANVEAQGTEIAPIPFNWTVTVKGLANATRTGSVGGKNLGEKESGNWKELINLAPIFFKQKNWLGAHIDYGVTFDNTPTPTINYSQLVLPQDIEIYNKTKAGCDVRIWSYRWGYNTVGEVEYNWYPTSPDVKFNWSVTGPVQLEKTQSSPTVCYSYIDGTPNIGSRDYSLDLSTAPNYEGGAITGIDATATLTPVLSGKTLGISLTKNISGNVVSGSVDGKVGCFNWEVIAKGTEGASDQIEEKVGGFETLNTNSPIKEIPFSVTLSPKHGGAITSLSLKSPLGDYDDNPNIRTELTFSTIVGNKISGKLQATNLFDENSMRISWPNSNATYPLTPASVYQTIISGSCFKYNPGYSDRMLTLLPTPAHVTLGVPPYKTTSISNSNVSAAFVNEIGDYQMKVTTDVVPAWATSMDPTLPGGKVIVEYQEFNNTRSPNLSDFRLESAPIVFSAAYQSPNMAVAREIKEKYSFWSNGSAIIDNPHVKVNDGWHVQLFYPDGSEIKDLIVDRLADKASNTDNSEANDDFKVRLAPDYVPKVFVRLIGSPGNNGGYSLFYKKTSDSAWKTIPTNGSANNGTLGYWDVTGLNGQYDLKLVVFDNNGITTKQNSVVIGKSIEPGSENYVTSQWNKAFIKFAPNTVSAPINVTITPVWLSDSGLKVDPNLPQPIGAVYKLQPTGTTFNADAPAEFSVRFTYDEMMGKDPGQLTIYHIKADGSLEPLDVKLNYEHSDGDDLFEPGEIVVVSAPLTSFSDLLVIKDLRPPVLLNLPEMTNQREFNLHGYSEPYSKVDIYSGGSIIGTTRVGAEGYFTLPIGLLEGDNRISAAATRYFDGLAHVSDRSEAHSVTLDTIAPTALVLQSDLAEFSPNGDGLKDKVKYSFSVSEPSKNTLKIYDSNGDLFWEKEINNQSQAGECFWDGASTFGRKKGGNYIYQLLMEDKAGNIGTSEAKTIYVDYHPYLISFAYAQPPVFSGARRTAIKYNLTKNNLWTTIEIVDGRGPVKTLVKAGKQDRGDHEVSWTGDFNEGWIGSTAKADPTKVNDGAYQFRVYVEDPEGGSEESKATVVVDNQPPALTLKPVDVDPISKQGEVRYSLSEKAAVSIELRDSDNRILQTYNEEKSAGEYAFESGAIEFPGDCYFKIKAIDQALNSDEKISEKFTVCPEELKITDVQAEPATFTPNADGRSDVTTIKYCLAGEILDYKVSVDILSPGGSTIKQLAYNEEQLAGGHFFVWDGRDKNNNYVADGEYQVAIAVEDLSGKRIVVGKTILVVSTLPTVDLALVQSAFSPNGDGVNDSLTINYSVDYPEFYVPGPLAVKLEVISYSGEILQEKYFTKSVGKYTYEYDGKTKNGETLGSGHYYLRISGQDALNTFAVPKVVVFTVDLAQPDTSGFIITPNYANLGATVKINLTYDELLSAPPVVKLTLSDGTARDGVLAQANGNNYVFQYLVAENDPDGIVNVSAAASDLAQNSVIKTGTFEIDKKNPSITTMSYSANPAKAGDFIVNFSASEKLGNMPKVIISPTGKASREALVFQAGDSYWATCPIIGGDDGTAEVRLEIVDRAGNVWAQIYHDLLIDTGLPQFSKISANPKNAAIGPVTIYLSASEPLPINPVVKVNDNPAVFATKLSNMDGTIDYSYTYTVKSTDLQGLATINISGFDSAGNEGSCVVSDAVQGIKIDTKQPQIGITDEAGVDLRYIANPGVFTPNNDGNQDIVAFQYDLNEYSQVTVRVHEYSIGNQYDASNLVATLIGESDNIWQGTGLHTITWNGKVGYNKALYDQDNNLYVDGGKFGRLGKYVYIVEARDEAGNLFKIGGTFWVQDKLLSLDAPASYSGEDNPNPKTFSAKHGVTSLFYKVTSSLSPQQTEAPRVVKIMDAGGQKIGIATFEIYNKLGVPVASFAWEPLEGMYDRFDWDGKDNLGNQLPDGEYKIRISVVDYSGVAASGSPYEVSVSLDNTDPVITDNQSGDDNWRNGKDVNGNPVVYSYDVDFTDPSVEGVSAKLSKAEYSIWTGPDQTGSCLKNSKIFENLDGSSFNVDWPIDFNACQQGMSYVSVRVFDNAGNYSGLNDVYYIKKDIEPPVIQDNQDGDIVWRTANDGNYNVDLFDTGGSNLSRFDVKVCGAAGQGGALIKDWTQVIANLDVASYTTDWQIPADVWSTMAEGINFFSVRAYDNAGNSSGEMNDLFYVKKDIQPPYFSLLNNDSGHCPVNQWTNHKSPQIAFIAADDGSGVASVHGFVDGVDQGIISSPWQPTLNDGTHEAYLQAIDIVGHTTKSAIFTYRIDTTPPSVSSWALSPVFFNQMYSSTEVSFIVDDAIANQVKFNIGVYEGTYGSGTKLVKTLWRQEDGFVARGAKKYYWDGKNDLGDYVNEGTYYVKIYDVADEVGNVLPLGGASNIYAGDDIRLPDLDSGMHAEAIKIAVNKNYIHVFVSASEGRFYYLRSEDGGQTWSAPYWLGQFMFSPHSFDVAASDNGVYLVYNQYDENNQVETLRLLKSVDNGNSWAQIGDYPIFNGSRSSFPAYQDHGYNSRVRQSEPSILAHGSDVHVVYVEKYSGGFPNPYGCLLLDCFSIDNGLSWNFREIGSSFEGYSSDYMDQLSSPYIWREADCKLTFKMTLVPYESSFISSNWTTPVVAGETDNCIGSGRRKVYGEENVVHKMIKDPQYDHTNGLYQRSYDNGQTWLSTVQIVKGQYSGQNYNVTDPVMGINGNDLYISWINSLAIYFQKIPANFAPASNNPDSRMKTAAINFRKIVYKATTFESPSLIAPTKDRQDVQNIRPAFEWQHHKTDTTEYRVEVAKNDSFTIDHQTFSKAAGTGAQDKVDSNLYTFNYAIHEFDPGLERNTDYFWKVTALSPTNAATSETWGFRIQPELTLVGVTNYPNPFNPNREQTKIRYRLSADADEVRIRIYDITGSLVTELDGTTNGEGMSVWQKYNDVSWDGRNGRGDLVVNGIYPFEITARIGDKTVSGRGKIAVLK